MRIAGALKEFLLYRGLWAKPRQADPEASWEKPAPAGPELPPFVPGPADGAFDHPVVDPEATELAQAIPSLGRKKHPHRNDHERVVIRVEHEASRPPKG